MNRTLAGGKALNPLGLTEFKGGTSKGSLIGGGGRSRTYDVLSRISPNPLLRDVLQLIWAYYQSVPNLRQNMFVHHQQQKQLHQLQQSVREDSGWELKVTSHLVLRLGFDQYDNLAHQV
jgi:hypothetical protein